SFVGGKPQTPSQERITGLQSPLARKVREWITLDLIASYTFNLPAPVAQQEVAGYAKDGGKNVKMKDGKDKNVMPVSTAEYHAFASATVDQFVHRLSALNADARSVAQA